MIYLQELHNVHIFILKSNLWKPRFLVMYFIFHLIFENYFSYKKIRAILFLLQILLVGETTPGARKTTGGPSKNGLTFFCPNNLVKGLKISPLTSEKKSFIYRVTYKH